MGISSVLCLLLIVVFSTTAHGGYSGCYKEIRPMRHFRWTPSYNKTLTTPTVCQQACFRLKKYYAGLTQGEYCFCAADTGTLVQEVDANCNSPCSGDPSASCGSKTHVSVWQTPQPIEYVRLQALDVGSTPGRLYVVNEMVQLSVTVAPASLVSLLYTFSYEREQSWKTDDLGAMHSTAFSAPGDYIVMAGVIDSDEINPLTTFRTSLHVTDAPDDVTLSCAQLYYATNELITDCGVSVRGGYDLDLTVTGGAGLVSYSMAIKDAFYPRAGWHVPRSLASPTASVAGTYVTTKPYFSKAGELWKWEFYAVITGTVTFALLRPAPTCTYCPDTNKCSACAGGLPGVASCNAADNFCTSEGVCEPTCGTTVNHYATPPNDYTIVQTYSHTITTTGYGSFEADGQLVQPGDVIAFSSSSAIIATRAAQANDVPDRLTGITLTVGGSVTGLSGLPNNGIVHYYRAIAREVNDADISLFYTIPGTYDVTVQASSRLRTLQVVSNTTTVILEESISALTLICPSFGNTMAKPTINLATHTGSSVVYTWYVDDIEVINTTVPSLAPPHAGLAIAGNSNVTVKAWNHVSEQWAWCQVQMQNPVVGLKATSLESETGLAASINVSLTSGTDYNCTWDWADGSPDGWSNVVNTPAAGSTHSHVFSTAGVYSAAVTCSNDVSSETFPFTHTVLDPITGLSLVTIGALRNVPVTVSLEYATGTGVSMDVDIDGVTYPFTPHASIVNRWQSTSSITFPNTGSFTLIAVASNAISADNFTGPFIVDAHILNPSSTLSNDQVNLNDSFTLSITMSEGSSVVVTLDWGDGTANFVHSLATLENWSPGFILNVTHSYPIPGVYQTIVNIRNNYDTYNFTHTIYAMNTVDNVVVTSNTPTAFLTGGVDVTFTFTSLPYAPTLGTITFISLGAAEYNVTPYQDLEFGLQTTFTVSHRFVAPGSYNVTAEVCNPRSCRTLVHVVSIQLPIKDFTIAVVPPHSVVNTQVTLKATVFSGTGVTYELDWGDATTETVTRAGTNPWEFDKIPHTYVTTGKYTIKAVSRNPVSTITKTYVIVIQNPVLKPAFTVTGGITAYTAGQATPVPVTLILQFDGTTIFPDDPSISIDFGDGKTLGPEPLVYPSSPNPNAWSWTHSYPGVGDWHATIRITNLASGITINTVTGVFEALAGLAVTPKYRRDIATNAPYILGFKGNTFPLQRPVAFFATVTSGLPLKYKVEAVAVSGGSIHTCESEVSPIQLPFTLPGEYIVNIDAMTPMETKRVTQHIVIEKDLSGIELEQPNLTRKPKAKYDYKFAFTTFSTAGCVLVDFGESKASSITKETDAVIIGGNCSSYVGYDAKMDGLPSYDLTPRAIVPHTYTDTGYYVINVTIFTPYGTSGRTFPVAISTEACTNPLLQFRETSEDFLIPTKVQRSVSYTVRTVFTCDCTDCANLKSWAVNRIDPRDGSTIATMTLNSSTYKADLFVPKRSLEYGVYKLCYTVTMELKPFRSTICGYIEVTASPLVASVMGNSVSAITVPWQSRLTVAANTHSYDPDMDISDNQYGLTFTSFCKQFYESLPAFLNGSYSSLVRSTPYSEVIMQKFYAGDSSVIAPDIGGCFRQGPGAVMISANKLELTGNFQFSVLNMLPNESYTLTVQTYKDSRIAEANLKIIVSPGQPALITISCKEAALCRPQADGIWFNSMNDLRLVADCRERCGSLSRYEWTVERKGLADSWIQIENGQDLLLGAKSAEVSASAKLFSEFPDMTEYRFSVRGWNTDGTMTEAYTNIFLNMPPTPGICNVTAMAGSLRHIKCRGFYDPDGITSYLLVVGDQEAKYGEDDTTLRALTYLGDKEEVEFYLPYTGDKDIYLYIKAIDIHLASTLVYIAKDRVAMPTASDLNKWLVEASRSEYLDRLLHEGDIHAATNKLLNFVSMINKNSEYADLSMPDDPWDTSAKASPMLTSVEIEERLAEYEANRDRNAQLRELVISTINNFTTDGNISSTQVALNAMVAATQVPSELTLESQSVVSTFLVDKVADLQTFAAEIPLKELKDTAKSIFSIISNLFEANTKQRKNPITTDKIVAKSSEYFPYVVTIYTDDKRLEAGLKADDQQMTQAAQKLQNDTISRLAPSLMSCMDQMIKLMLGKTVAGEPPHKIDVEAMSMVIHKDMASKLSRYITAGDARVELPYYCDLVPMQQPCSPEQIISYSMVTVDSNAYSSLDTQNGPPVLPDTATVKFDIRDEKGEIIPMKQLRQPIVLGIPHKNGYTVEGNHTTVRLSKNITLQHMFCRAVTLTQNQALMLEIIPEDMNIRMVALLRFGKHPCLTNHSGCYDAYAYLPNNVGDMPISTKDNAAFRQAYTLFMDNENVTHYRTVSGSDNAYFCIRRLNHTNSTEFHIQGPPLIQIVANDVTPYNVTFRTPAPSCCYKTTDRGADIFVTDGLSVSPRTTVTMTWCETRHLTTFSSGWVVKPNAIDFDYVFANMDFYKNPTLYVAEMIVLVVYVVFFIWARRKDIQDVTRLGVTPLPDNDPTDNYYYEITVQTGLRKNAATDSKVHFILSGEFDETDVRLFEDTERKIFRRGALDTFLLTTERPLGPLSYARVWHDNSGKGKYQSWYLNYMIVRDLQTKERFFFIANEWFAVEESDGQIDRLLPVSGPEQMREVGHLMANSASKKLGDDHIWFSVVARPPESRFTRIQRLSCCLCLLFTSMLANAMYYETTSSGAGATGLNIGPFSLTPEQIYVGIISNLVVFPVNFLIMTLFRKSRPRRKRSSRLMDAIRRNEENCRKQQMGSLDHMSIFSASCSDLKPLAGSEQRSFTPVGETRDLTRPLEPGVRRNTDDISIHHNMEPNKAVKKPFSFPWWCRIISWIILWIAVLVSVTFVTFYGIQFGDDKTRKWITSLVVSFLTSIFLTQPIKVFVMALLLSLIFKKSDLVDEVAEEDEEELRLANDETWLHPQPGQMAAARRHRKLAYCPPDPEILREARENRLKEILMYDILREILFYTMFLWIALVVSFGFRDPNAFHLKNNLQLTVTSQGLGQFGNSSNNFQMVRKMSELWSWLDSTLVPAIRAGPWYNGYQPYGLRGYGGDKVSRLMGYAVLRQLRIEEYTCDPVKAMHSLVPDCYTPYSIFKEDKANYGVGWKPFQGNQTQNNSGEEWVYRGALELEGWPYIGNHAIYNGGGYVVELRENTLGLKEKIAQLMKDEWIDRRTRAVFIEFTVYNAQVNLFGIVTYIAEFLNTGGIQPYMRVEPMNLLGYKSRVMLFQVICQILFISFIVFFIIKEIRKLRKDKCAYFKEPWNYVELSIILLSIGGIVIYFYRFLKMREMVARFTENHGNLYMKFQYVAYWNELLLYMLGWMIFLATIKFIRLLRFNRRMNLLAQTLRHAARPLAMFFILFMIIFTAYVQFFYFVYSVNLTDFANMIFAAETCMQMLIGKFDFDEMKGASPVLGPLFFFLYIVSVYFILINMFLTILNESFASVRSDVNLQTNEYEMVDFLVKRFSQWSGIGGGPKGKSKEQEEEKAPVYVDPAQIPIEEQIDNFPERVDRLMDTISKVFLDSGTFDSMVRGYDKGQNKEAMKLMMKKPHQYNPGSGQRY